MKIEDFFSYRNGHLFIRDELQIEEMDNALRVALWNAIYNSMLKDFGNALTSSIDEHVGFLFKSIIWEDFLARDSDQLPSNNNFKGIIKSLFYQEPWHVPYTILEIALHLLDKSNEVYQVKKYRHLEIFKDRIRMALQRHRAGYSLAGNRFISIMTNTEIDTVEFAVNIQEQDSDYKYAGVHLSKALKHLSPTESNPDFRNSIKESISAVEAACKQLTGQKTLALGTLLGSLRRSGTINQKLISAFEKLYIYTNGPDGIRHSATQDANVDYQDALFMLVTSSAFIKWLFTNSDIIKEGLIK